MQHKLELGNQNVNSSSCGEATDEGFRQIYHQEPDLQNPQEQLEGEGQRPLLVQIRSTPQQPEGSAAEMIKT